MREVGIVVVLVHHPVDRQPVSAKPQRRHINNGVAKGELPYIWRTGGLSLGHGGHGVIAYSACIVVERVKGVGRDLASAVFGRVHNLRGPRAEPAGHAVADHTQHERCSSRIQLLPQIALSGGSRADHGRSAAW